MTSMLPSVPSTPLGVLDHDHGVGVGRDHAAGVDQRGLADAQLRRC